MDEDDGTKWLFTHTGRALGGERSPPGVVQGSQLLRVTGQRLGVFTAKRRYGRGAESGFGVTRHRVESHGEEQKGQHVEAEVAWSERGEKAGLPAPRPALAARRPWNEQRLRRPRAGLSW